MSYDLVIKNGTIVTAETTYRADIGIRGERIAAIGEDLSGTRELDAAGRLVIPGAVDVHVHFDLDLGSGIVSSDDYDSGSRAAAIGGTTTIIDFVHPEPGESMMEALGIKRAQADFKTVIDYALHMNISPAELPQLETLPAIVAAGITTFKLYMAYARHLKDSELLQALDAIKAVGALPIVHAENWDVICALVERNLTGGHTTPYWHPRSRPALLEAEAAGRVIDLAAWLGTPLHILHVGAQAVVERIATARARGLQVYAETCPQYLLLTEDRYSRPDLEGALPVCAPPLRTAADQAHLWRALARNDLQLISTDHCPLTKAHKARGLDDFSQIPGGVPSLEARLALIYTYGVLAGHISANRWVDLCCTTPARLHHLYRKGHIAVGYDADLVIFDPEAEITLSTNTLHENVDWTPYEGLQLQGWPSATLSRGEIIAQNGECTADAGRGRFVARTLQPA